MRKLCPRCGGSVLPDPYGDLMCWACARPYGPQCQPRLETPVKARTVMLPVYVPPGANRLPPTPEQVGRARKLARCEALLRAGVGVYGAARESGVSERTAYRIEGRRVKAGYGSGKAPGGP